ncbi:MAG: hypothetical protein WCJ10_06825, partial [Opitutaceae bacterium]
SDLEINPGATLTFAGAVHSNDDIYLGSDGASALYDSLITSAGNIYRHRKDNANYTTGNVSIKDSGGAYRDMKLGTGWLESVSSVSWAPLSRLHGYLGKATRCVPCRVWIALTRASLRTRWQMSAKGQRSAGAAKNRNSLCMITG